MKISTRTGDTGMSSLFSGGRVPKNHPLLECYGSLDETASFIGLLIAECQDDTISRKLTEIQASLFSVGGTLADLKRRLPHDPSSWSTSPLDDWIEELESELPPLESFILPGGSSAAAAAHVARAVSRRAERIMQGLPEAGFEIPEGALPFLNRLSDLLFLLARHINTESGVSETPWKGTTD